MWEIIARYVESVNRLDEKVGVRQTGENNGEYCWPDPCIPDDYGDGNQEQRICHVVEVEALQEKRRAERHGDGNQCKTVAKDVRAGKLQLEVRPGHGSPRLDRVRGRSRDRLSEGGHHTVETSTRRGPGVLAGGCVLYPPNSTPLLLPDGIVFHPFAECLCARSCFLIRGASYSKKSISSTLPAHDL